MSEKSIKPIAENSTPKVEETMQAHQTPPTFSLIDKAIADAHLLEEEGKIAAALEKWHSLANVVEEVDNEVAARAWFSIGTLLLKQEKKKKALKFRPEHRDVLNWLNRNTSTALQFFGVEIKVFQIADSPYAPEFTVVTDMSN